MTKLELIKENAKLKYGITEVIDSISNIREFIDLKRYLIELIDGNDEIKLDKYFSSLKKEENQNKKLQHQLEEKDEIIDEAINLANNILNLGWDYSEKDNVCIKLLETLERGKNGR